MRTRETWLIWFKDFLEEWVKAGGDEDDFDADDEHRLMQDYYDGGYEPSQAVKEETQP